MRLPLEVVNSESLTSLIAKGIENVGVAHGAFVEEKPGWAGRPAFPVPNKLKESNVVLD